MRKKLLLFLLLTASIPTYAQTVENITLERAIEIAHMQAPKALMARLTFMSKYWSFRSYKAELLPSLNVEAELGNYNRSLVEVRNSTTGEISYVANNSLTNSLEVAIEQNIALTGGTISLNSDITRLDQFDYDNKIFSTSPVSISYTQPIRGFNTLKWKKETAPREFESAKRTYLESMETITINTATYFFAVIIAESNYQKAVTNSKDTERLYEIAKKRFDIGAITKSELLQLELSLLNSSLAINTSQVSYDVALFNFKSYLGIYDSDRSNIRLLPPTETPNIILDYDRVLELSYENSGHNLSIDLKRIEAKMEVAKARANKGLQIEFSADLGYSKSANTFPTAYKGLKDEEVVGVTLSMPIYDWGLSKGQVKMAEAELELVLSEIAQEEQEFIQDIRIKVMEFNNQSTQCKISEKAKAIADERYEITKKRFENGSTTVTELNNAQEQKDNAEQQYVTQLRAYWQNYFEVQKSALYDFINKKNISTEFDKLIE